MYPLITMLLGCFWQSLRVILEAKALSLGRATELCPSLGS